MACNFGDCCWRGRETTWFGCENVGNVILGLFCFLSALNVDPGIHWHPWCIGPTDAGSAGTVDLQNSKTVSKGRLMDAVQGFKIFPTAECSTLCVP